MPVIISSIAFAFVCKFLSYNTGKSALPNTHDARGCTAPKVECIYIRQSTSACVNMLHFQHSKIHPNLKATAQLAYIVTDADCYYWSLF